MASTALQRITTEVATSVQVDRRLIASLPRSVASTLRETAIDRTTDAYGYDSEFMGYAAIEAPPDDVETALALVDEALVPASPTVVKSELARLRVTTKSRAESQDDLRITAAAYAEYLSDYPADVVIDALRSWAKMEKWWPAWAELKDLLDRRVRRREALRRALGRARLVYRG